MPTHRIDPVAQACFDEVTVALGEGEGSVKTKAREYLADILALRIPPDTHRPGPWLWVACSVLMALFEGGMPGGKTLGDVLKATGLRPLEFDDFLAHLALLSQRLEGLSDDVRELAGSLRQSWNETSCVYSKYVQLWSHRHKVSPVGLPSLGDDDRIMPGAFSFGWYLYINVNQDKDLVASFHVMLASLEFVLRHAKGKGEGESAGEGRIDGGARSTLKSEVQKLQAEGRVKREEDKDGEALKKGKGKKPARASSLSPSLPSRGTGKAVMESMEEDAIAALFMMG
ncbi:hypothetical protein VYU27_010259, partial [Nannochloropsis oceanica]